MTSTVGAGPGVRPRPLPSWAESVAPWCEQCHNPHSSLAYSLRGNIAGPDREAEAGAAEGNLPPLPELPYVPALFTQACAGAQRDPRQDLIMIYITQYSVRHFFLLTVGSVVLI